MMSAQRQKLASGFVVEEMEEEEEEEEEEEDYDDEESLVRIDGGYVEEEVRSFELEITAHTLSLSERGERKILTSSFVD